MLHVYTDIQINLVATINVFQKVSSKGIQEKREYVTLLQEKTCYVLTAMLQ